MKKFSSKFFDQILSMREDVEEIFQSLIDIGFDFDMSTYYSDMNFNQISQKYMDSVNGYYYGFEILLKRELFGSGHQIDGSFVYEEDIDLVRDLYDSIGRLKNTYTRYKIYYHLSNGRIMIRVIIGSKMNKTFTDYQKLQDILLNITDDNMDSDFLISVIGKKGYYLKDVHTSSLKLLSTSFYGALTVDAKMSLSNSGLTNILSGPNPVTNLEDYSLVFHKILNMVKIELEGDSKVDDDSNTNRLSLIGSVSKNGKKIFTISLYSRPDDFRVGKFTNKKNIKVFVEGDIKLKLL